MVTSLVTAAAGVMHERIATPLIRTVHAPHCASPQPNRGPRRFRSLRSTYRRGVAGSTSTSWVAPLTRRETTAIGGLRCTGHTVRKRP